MGLFNYIKICLAGLGCLVGIALIGMGIGTYQVQNEIADLLKDVGIPRTATAFVIVGATIFVLSLMSLWSSLQNTLLYKLIYCLVLGAIIAVFLTIAILVYAKHATFLENTGKMYDKIWKNREEKQAQTMIDELNKFLRCCGKTSTGDYADKLPTSCCKTLALGECTVVLAYHNGCRKALQTYISSKSKYILIVSIAGAVILFLIVMSTLKGG